MVVSSASPIGAKELLGEIDGLLKEDDPRPL